MSIYPIFYLLKKMNKGSIVVLISSNWIIDGKAGFSHYLTSKGALESLFKSLAKENKDINFLLFRAPRMLTDQTNLSIKKEKLISPKTVSAKLLKEIIVFPKNQNFLEI
jgi:NAD(P)-dependent dehydrogenase (short-subunit alcohol dehydrogenase family)